jgi:hypothetical protein
MRLLFSSSGFFAFVIADKSAGYKYKMFIRTMSVAARFIGLV